jgi:hypothetical protein
MPFDAEYRPDFGSRAVSTSLSTMCLGVGMSGLPMPKSMMSTFWARSFALRRLTSSKTYGGSRRMRWNSGVMEP